MTESETVAAGDIELAERAADQLFDARNKEEYPDYEPAGLEAAQAAIQRLGSAV